MIAKVTIRPMTSGDVKAVSRIVADDYRFLASKEGYSAEQLEGVVSVCASERNIESWISRSKCFVAVAGRRVVGALAIEGNEIEELWVAPECHGMEVGTTLFKVAEEHIVRAGHSVLTIHNTGNARGFYERMGATVVATMICDCGPLVGRTLICLEKRLE